jgi:hypothetical protein
MEIPESTKKPRYYVAVSEKECLSSWGSMEEATNCIERFRGTEDYKKILGIIRVSGTLRATFPKEKKLGKMSFR